MPSTVRPISEVQPTGPAPATIPCPPELDPAPTGHRASMRLDVASTRGDDRQRRIRALVDGVRSGTGPLGMPGADLRGTNFAELREHGLPRDLFDGADLSGAVFSGACLNGLRMRGARLDGALMIGADLRGTDLSTATLRGVHLTGANLRRADLSFCDLRGASLLTADLSQVNAAGADLRDVLLNASNLTRAVLRGADLRWASLEGSRMAGADLRGARFSGATLCLSDLTGARVSARTEFEFALLHRARLDHVALTRHHLGQGIGEACADLLKARDTYRALCRHFAEEGQDEDARWAFVRARRMDTLAHRPDRAPRYFDLTADGSAPHRSARGSTDDPGSAGQDRASAGTAWSSARKVGALFRHTVQWLAGEIDDRATAYGTSYRRILATLALVWLSFGVGYQWAGGLTYGGDLRGLEPRWWEGLHYSAAALTPIDAYPLTVTAQLAHGAAIIQGVIGIVLFGALGYVTASRYRHL